MNFIKVHNLVEQEFNSTLASLVVAAYAVHMIEPFIDTDFENVKDNEYGQRVRDKIKETLWQHEEHLDDVLRIIAVHYDYELAESMNLVDSERQSLKQMFDASLDTEKQTGVKYNNYFGA